MRIAISPCPNDTFVFHAWIKGLVGTPPEVTFADIEELNELALTRTYPLVKLSFNCYKEVADTYELLPVGAAFGYRCGPMIIAKHDGPYRKIAIPGRHTTAHFLLDHLLPPYAEKHFCLYHEVTTLIDQGVVDCGLIIHETRFTYKNQGFHLLYDLGEMWEERYTLPVPLGGIAIKRNLPNKDDILETLQASHAYAKAHPLASRPFILEHAQEKDEIVVQKHIDTYVSEEMTQEEMQCLQNVFFSPSLKKPQAPSNASTQSK